MKNIIKEFIKTPSKDKYRYIILNIEYDKCRICDDVIYYYDSSFSFKENEVHLKGKSFKSHKIVDKIYNLSVCEDCLKLKFPEYKNKNKSRVFNQMNSITEFAFNIPRDKAQKWISEKYVISEENLIKKHGEVLGKEKWIDYKKKQAESNSFGYKQEKYGWDLKAYEEYNKSRSVTLKNLIKKHGEENGLSIWNSYLEKQSYSTTITYFIETYGNEEGLKKYENFSNKRCFNSGYSKISQDFFIKVDDELKLDSQYAIKNGEKVFLFKGNKSDFEFRLDYYIPSLNIGIEFNGDKWHANPSIYEEKDYPLNFINKPAKSYWEKDEIKNGFLRKKLNKLIIIWEKDLKERGVEKIIQEIKNEINI